MLVADLVDAIIRREGGYVNNHADKGGPTNFGITQAKLAEWRGRDVTALEVQNMRRDEAEAIYAADYIRPFTLLREMQPRLLGLLADSAVNHGTERAIKWLQEAIKTPADGAIGPKTLIAWEPYAKNLIDRDKVYRDILARRIVFYGEIVFNRPDQRVFIVGWLKRAVEFLS